MGSDCQKFLTIQRVTAMKSTFPDTRPEDITIIGIHHNPLAIERIFEYGTKEKMRATRIEQRGGEACTEKKRTYNRGDRCS